MPSRSTSSLIMPPRKTPASPDTPVCELWNLSDTTASWLEAEGIHTHAQLAQADLVALWLALRAQHRQVTRLMYYALWGAVHDCHWRMVPDEAKESFERRVAAAEPGGGARAGVGGKAGARAPRPRATKRSPR